MTFTPSTVAKILDARGISHEDASKAAGMSLKKLRATLSGENIPTRNQIVNLAARLAVPPYAFFAENYEVPTSPIIDFRASMPASMKYGNDAARFSHIFKIRDFLASLYIRLGIETANELFSIDLDENPEQFARAVESMLDLGNIRQKSKDKPEFFRSFRSAVESLGIYVIQDHNMSINIDGFALYHETSSSNLIYINTLKRNSGAKSFTLAHELAHIFGKRSAISNNYQYDNAVEAYANEFAASLLIPRDELLYLIETKKYFFNSYDVAKNSAERLSEYFKCSISAMFVRLNRLGFCKSEYVKNFLSGFGKSSFLDTEKAPVFGPKDGPKPGVVDLAFFGTRATQILALALQSGRTTKYEIFENTGLPKKRIESLVQLAIERNIIEPNETKQIEKENGFYT